MVKDDVCQGTPNFCQKVPFKEIKNYGMAMAPPTKLLKKLPLNSFRPFFVLRHQLQNLPLKYSL